MRRMKRQLRSRQSPLTIGLVALFFVILGAAVYVSQRQYEVDPMSYRPLLRLIGEVESANNYNAYYGNAGNDSIQFTEMTIAEVLQWQDEYVRQGGASDAVGRYQIMSTTLSETVQRLGINSNNRYDSTMQDTLAIALLERRGSKAYANGRLTRDEFAASLAQEWAALPKVLGDNPSSSYYAGDGLNRALISVEAIQKAIDPIRLK